jgi:hypothetical protein
VNTFASRDEDQVAAYAETMETIFAHWEDIALTVNHVKQLHRDLLKYSSKDERHRTKQGCVLSDAAADTTDHSHGSTRLAILADLLPGIITKTKEAP